LYALLVAAASGSPLTCDVLSAFMRLVTPLPHAGRANGAGCWDCGYSVAPGTAGERRSEVRGQ